MALDNEPKLSGPQLPYLKMGLFSDSILQRSNHNHFLTRLLILPWLRKVCEVCIPWHGNPGPLQPASLPFQPHCSSALPKVSTHQVSRELAVPGLVSKLFPLLGAQMSRSSAWRTPTHPAVLHPVSLPDPTPRLPSSAAAITCTKADLIVIYMGSLRSETLSFPKRTETPL